MNARLAFKVDVDTDRGTREGVLRLMDILKTYGAPASFLFSFGPDNTGKAVRRVFRPGFLKKVRRTKVASNYGIKTLMNGTLLPAPMIAKRNSLVLRSVQREGFECGIHSWDHFKWQDHVHKMPQAKIAAEIDKALGEFVRIFEQAPDGIGAPGWQCNERSLQVYDDAEFLWASDTRVQDPYINPAFYPRIGKKTFKTLHISSTLPTLDELMGRPEFPNERINTYLLDIVKKGGTHIHTIHAEIEGLNYANMFADLLKKANQLGIEFFSIRDWANELKKDATPVPVCKIEMDTIDGRSGNVAVQRAS